MIARGWRNPYSIVRVAAGALILLALSASVRAGEARLVKFPNSQLEPVAWNSLDGWAEDDHLAAFGAFMTSCKAILSGSKAQREAKPVYGALYEACRRAADAKPADAAAARAFFEQSFRPVRISPLGDPNGFLTGYYEPIVDGARERTGEFAHPLYRRPDGLLRSGRMLKASVDPGKKGKSKRKMRLMPFYDRTAIENGALAGRNLEICYLKDPIDAFFVEIQGSARVRLGDGSMMRVNYAAQNGHKYFAVGKVLIDRGIVPKEEMSMDRIRQWMAANPEEGRDLRRMNRSFVFFRETGLADNEEAIGAQGVSLTANRSIAVDRNLHIYGTPFFIQAELPLANEKSSDKFRRLMIAQDAGGAITGIARADLYFGAGDEAGRVSGRLKHPGRFVMLFPNEIDPVAARRDVPLPAPRPAIDQVASRSDQKPAPVAVSAPQPSKAEAKKREVKKPEVKKREAKKPESKSALSKLFESKKSDAKKKPDKKRASASKNKPEAASDKHSPRS